MSSLEVRNISKTFINNGQEKRVLEQISFTIKDGTFVTLLGPSGCGKTTCLTIIAGFQQADSGEILVEDKRVTQPGSDRSFVFQNYALFPWMSVKDNILFPMNEAKMDKATKKERLDYLLGISHLKGHENLYPHQISGGMKQRTALVRALACTPKVLLMDEPMGALDIQMRQSLQVEVEDIWSRVRPTVLMVTHDVDEAVYLSDRIIVMSTDSGKIVFDKEIRLERPRNRSDAEYMRISNRLSEILRTMNLKKMEQEVY